MGWESGDLVASLKFRHADWGIRHRTGVSITTMKNTAARVGPRGVQGARARPREGRRCEAPSTTPTNPIAPRWSKNVWSTRTLGRSTDGANLASLRERGNPAGHRPQNTAIAEKNPRRDTAVPSEARAPAPTQEGRGRALWRGGRGPRRSPTRATARVGPPEETARPDQAQQAARTAGGAGAKRGERGRSR